MFLDEPEISTLQKLIERCSRDGCEFHLHNCSSGPICAQLLARAKSPKLEEPPTGQDELSGKANARKSSPQALRALYFQVQEVFEYRVMRKLKGLVLTQIDAVVPEGQQNKAFKDMVKTHFNNEGQEYHDRVYNGFVTNTDAPCLGAWGIAEPVPVKKIEYGGVVDPGPT